MTDLTQHPTTARTRLPRLARLSGALAITALALAGCAPGAAGGDPDADGHDAPHQHYFMTDAWVKTAPDGMTAAFGIIDNDGHHDVTLVSASTPAASAVELHETVQSGTAMQMREKDGGFPIPMGERLVLEPGGNHLMLMGLTAPIVAGDEIEFTLVFSDGEEVTFLAPAKDYAGANEEYAGDHDEHGDGHGDDGHEH